MTQTPGVDARVGTQTGGYRIESVLGRGGMSVVYLAEDIRLRTKVALKLLDAHLGEDERFRKCFLRELELAASIDHPHVVPIYDAGESDGLYRENPARGAPGRARLPLQVLVPRRGRPSSRRSALGVDRMRRIDVI
jgi:serine/threonine protein kinase